MLCVFAPRRLQNWAQPNSPVFALYVLHILTSGLRGFWNFVAYGFNQTVQRALVNALEARRGPPPRIVSDAPRRTGATRCTGCSSRAAARRLS